ncbi:SDR family NAD(P)-dependent oxidoreductase [Denitratisoma oestradiolicum]|uniref:Putative oxidoreductase n=1 Tax=Denitratisoma oestradiolicum TaxID=311182 RepID=A0A6S6YE59_9PROT|nr:SDR family NAD(P)-dependent oxidoreductase [Denitratisoma oestradiolicum]TWO80798.1 short-chain dehydrogenase [Denitratisoma oestradiolicum]CAB1370886.1 putative oxidoreductase [Denitratisoma oestradiolicum]
MKNALDFSGKVVLVTGGGGGIGRGIAEAFDQCGAKVVVAEIDPTRAAATRAALGQEALVSVTDVRDSAQVKALIAEVEARHGRLDVLVNNVGDFLGIVKPLEDYSDEDFDALFSINLRQIFQVTRSALPLMKKSGPGGSIISISSIEAFRGIPINIVYSAFKAGIVGFTKSLAVELGQSGIRVNGIAPETTESEQVQPSVWIPPQYQEHIARWIPLGRFGTPADAAGCALFLASPLSGWVSGTTINLDGGALAAGGWYRTPQGGWTNVPVITGNGMAF